MRLGFLVAVLIQALVPPAFFGGSIVVMALLVSLPSAVAGSSVARQRWLKFVASPRSTAESPLSSISFILLCLTAAASEADFTHAVLASRSSSSGRRSLHAYPVGERAPESVEQAALQAAACSVSTSLSSFPSSVGLRLLRAALGLRMLRKASAAGSLAGLSRGSMHAQRALLQAAADIHLAQSAASPWNIRHRAAISGMYQALGEITDLCSSRVVGAGRPSSSVPQTAAAAEAPDKTLAQKPSLADMRSAPDIQVIRTPQTSEIPAGTANVFWRQLSRARRFEARALEASVDAISYAMRDTVPLGKMFSASVTRCRALRNAREAYEAAMAVAPSDPTAQFQYADFLQTNCAMGAEAQLIRSKLTANRGVSDSSAAGGIGQAGMQDGSTSGVPATCLAQINFAHDGSAGAMEIVDLNAPMLALVGGTLSGLRGRTIGDLFVPVLRSVLTAEIVQSLNAALLSDSSSHTHPSSTSEQPQDGHFGAPSQLEDAGILGQRTLWLLWNEAEGCMVPAHVSVEWARSDLPFSDVNAFRPLFHLVFTPAMNQPRVGAFLVADANSDAKSKTARTGQDAPHALDQAPDTSGNNSTSKSSAGRTAASHSLVPASQLEVLASSSTVQHAWRHHGASGLVSAHPGADAQMDMNQVKFSSDNMTGKLSDLLLRMGVPPAAAGQLSNHPHRESTHKGAEQDSKRATPFDGGAQQVFEAADCDWIFHAGSGPRDSSSFPWRRLGIVTVDLSAAFDHEALALADLAAVSGDSQELWKLQGHHVMSDPGSMPSAHKKRVRVTHGAVNTAKAPKRLDDIDNSSSSASTSSSNVGATQATAFKATAREVSWNFAQADSEAALSSNAVALSLRTATGPHVSLNAPAASLSGVADPASMSLSHGGTRSHMPPTTSLHSAMAGSHQHSHPAARAERAGIGAGVSNHDQVANHQQPQTLPVSQHQVNKTLLTLQKFSLALSPSKNMRSLPPAARTARSKRRAWHRARVCHVFMSLTELWTIPPAYFLTHLFIIVLISQPLHADLLAACRSVDLSSQRLTITSESLAASTIVSAEHVCTFPCSSGLDARGEFSILSSRLESTQSELRVQDSIVLTHLQDTVNEYGTSLQQPEFQPGNFSEAFTQFQRDASRVLYMSDTQRWVPLPFEASRSSGRVQRRYSLVELSDQLGFNLAGISRFNTSEMPSSPIFPQLQPGILRAVFVPAMDSGFQSRVQLVKFLTVDAAFSVQSVLAFVVSVPILLWLCIMVANAAFLQRDAYAAGTVLSGAAPAVLQKALLAAKSRLKEVKAPIQSLGGVLHSHHKLERELTGTGSASLSSAWERSLSAVSAGEEHKETLDDVCIARDFSNSSRGALRLEPSLQSQGPYHATLVAGAAPCDAGMHGQQLPHMRSVKKGNVFWEFLATMLILPGIVILVISMIPFNELQGGIETVFESSARIAWTAHLEELVLEKNLLVANQFYHFNSTGRPLANETSVQLAALTSQTSAQIEQLLVGALAADSLIDIDVSPLPDGSDAVQLLTENACAAEHAAFASLSSLPGCADFLDGVATRGGIRQLLLRQASLMEQLLSILSSLQQGSGSLPQSAADSQQMQALFQQIVHLQHTILRPATMALRRSLVEDAAGTIDTASDGMLDAWIGAVGLAAFLYMYIIPYLHYNGYRISAARTLLLQVQAQHQDLIMGAGIQGKAAQDALKTIVHNVSQRAM